MRDGVLLGGCRGRDDLIGGAVKRDDFVDLGLRSRQPQRIQVEVPKVGFQDGWSVRSGSTVM